MSRYPGRVLSSTAPTVNANSAKGIWTLDEAMRYQKAGTWPVPTGNGDPYFGLNTLLLPGQGTNGAQNNTFLDSSTNNFTITRNGNTTQGTFTPFSEAPGYWSNYFDGTGDYLTSASTSTELAMGTSAFTIEAWIYTADTSFMIACSTTTGGCGFGYNIDNGTQGLWVGRAGTGVDATSGVQLAYNAWNHVAVTRDSGNTVKFWVNGVQSGSNTTVTSNYGTSSQAVRIAADSNASLFNLDGYLSNVRITKGAALYTATFTPSTIPLTTTVSSGTVSLLTCQSNRFIDNSVNAFALTPSGTPSVQTFQPFGAPTSAYSAATIGGSGYFDGSGDYLTAPSNSAYAFGTGDFSVEFWYYPLAAVSSPGTDGLVSMSYTGGFHVLTDTTPGITFYIAGSQITASQAIPILQWNHFLCVRQSGTAKIYLNGTQVATGTLNGSITNSTVYVGTSSHALTETANGYFSSVRISNVARSATVPTAPYSNDSNTVLLLNYTNAGVIDNAVTNNLETVGGAQISTTQYKWGTSSVYFDGSGDYLQAPNAPWAQFGSGDFTIEFWMYASSQALAPIVHQTNYASNQGWILWNYDGVNSATSTRKLTFMFNGATTTLTTSSDAYTNNTWTHIAVVKVGTNVKIYSNGNSIASGTFSTAAANASTPVMVGGIINGQSWNTTAYYNGYIADLRITKGYARYLYNFTAPTAAFPLFYQAAATPSSDPYFQNTTLLLPGNGTNGAQNNTFLDSSTNAFSITRNGNTTQGTFTPFSKVDGRWGNYFDGTGDYLTTPSNAALSFGTGDFTVEFWYYHLSRASTDTIAAPSTDNLNIYINTSGVLGYYNGSSGQNSSCTVPLNEWGHVALVRSGSTLKMYYNGVEVLSQSNTTNLGTASWYIGTNPGNTDPSNGYISNLRLVKGTAVYTAAFTPSTTPLTAISGTSLLTCQSNRFIDNSTNAFAITCNGDVSIQTFSPFPTTASYDASVNGGSGYSDGSGDYLTVASNANLTLGSSDFTIELWWYPLAFNSDGEIFTMAGSGGTNRCFALYSSGSNGTLAAFAGTGGSSWDIVSNLSMGTAIRNAWNHMAFTRSGSTFSTYLNGTRIATTTATGTLGSTGLGVFANNGGGSQAPNSYISGARTVKGTALYTGSTYTIPTAPPTAVTNTNLLLNFTNGGIIDNAMSNDLETVGNVQISTTQSKFGGSSMYFDGTGDWLIFPSSVNYALGTGDFTWEMWLRTDVIPVTTLDVIFDTRPASTQGAYPHLYLDTDGKIKYYVSSADRITSTNAISINTWYHVALARYGTSTKLFIDGIQTGSTYTDSTNYIQSNLIIGAGYAGTSSINYGFQGYMDDFRLTKGIARYVQNFTPPTQALLTL